jgi:putative membrane protein
MWRRAHLRAALSLAVALLAAAPIHAQTGTESATPGNPPAVALSTEDYVGKAAAGDLFEIESSQLALETSKNEGVVAFARMMIEDHTRMVDALKEVVVGSGLDIPIPTAPEGDEAQRLVALRAAGDDFDRQYVGLQLQAHEQALTLHEAYAESGENAELRAIATTAVPVVTAHLEEIRRLAEPFMSTQQ